MSLPRFNLFQPKSVSEAMTFMKEMKGKVIFIAGGTDVIVKIRQRVLKPDVLISLERVDGLNQIHFDGSVNLGSMTCLRSIEKNHTLRRKVAVLCEAVDTLGSVQARNIATIGGNLCNASPAADCAPPLLVLDAKVKIEGPNGTREEPIENFFLGPGKTILRKGEILTTISIPEMEPGTCSAFLKIGRVVEDIAQVNVAALLVMKEKWCNKCRIAIGAVAEVPLRLRGVEELLTGREIDEGLLRRAQEETEKEVRPITDLRATKEYRRMISGVMTRRVIMKALNREEV